MLEKIFLLHEEFQKPDAKIIRHSRMTRHLYDLERLMDTKFCQEAIDDKNLYWTIVQHRKMITKISWVDYDKHQHKFIDFIPPDKVLGEWKQDYREMQESMFYGETLTFDKLIGKLTALRDRINAVG